MTRKYEANIIMNVLVSQHLEYPRKIQLYDENNYKVEESDSMCVTW